MTCYYLCRDELRIFIAATKRVRLRSRHDECRILRVVISNALMSNDWWLTQVPESPPEERSSVPLCDWPRRRFLALRQLRWLRISPWMCACWNPQAPLLLPDDNTSFDPASSKFIISITTYINAEVFLRQKMYFNAQSGIKSEFRKNKLWFTVTLLTTLVMPHRNMSCSSSDNLNVATPSWNCGLQASSAKVEIRCES